MGAVTENRTTDRPVPSEAAPQDVLELITDHRDGRRPTADGKTTTYKASEAPNIYTLVHHGTVGASGPVRSMRSWP